MARNAFHADVVIGSLTKDFCVNKGGLIATNDASCFRDFRRLVCEEGAGIDLIDRKSSRFHYRIESRSRPVLRRMEDAAGLAGACRRGPGRAARRRPLGSDRR